MVRVSVPVVSPTTSTLERGVPIELRCETAGCSIYYTINGLTPDPYQSFGEKYTLKYEEPIILPSGKWTIKALALLRDHPSASPSPIVTKKYQILDTGKDREYLSSLPAPSKESTATRLRSESTNKRSSSLNHSSQSRASEKKRAAKKEGPQDSEDISSDTENEIKAELKELTSTIHLMQGLMNPLIQSKLHSYSPPVHDPPKSEIPKKVQTCHICNTPRNERELFCGLCGSQFVLEEKEILKLSRSKEASTSPDLYSSSYHCPPSLHAPLHPPFNQSYGPHVTSMDPVLPQSYYLNENGSQADPYWQGQVPVGYPPTHGHEASSTMDMMRRSPYLDQYGVPSAEHDFLPTQSYTHAHLPSHTLPHAPYPPVAQIPSHDSRPKSSSERRTKPGESSKAKSISFRCPYCTAPIDQDARFCLSCENEIVRTQENVFAPPPSTSSPVKGSPDESFFVRPISSKRNGVSDKKRAYHSESDAVEERMSLPMNGKSVTCLSCNASNVRGTKRCVLCESTLPRGPRAIKEEEEEEKGGEQVVAVCLNCAKENEKESRFCSWCGFKMPLDVKAIIVCPECRLENAAGAKFCNDCATPLPSHADEVSSNTGLVRKAISKDEPVSWSILKNGLDSNSTRPSKRQNNHASMSSSAPPRQGRGPIPPEGEEGEGTPRRVKTRDAESQTTGLFYPSSTSLELKQRNEQKESFEAAELKQRKERHATTHDRSPGGGYWRAQIDHVCSQLKLYAKGNSVFQGALGHLVMRNVVYSHIEDDGQNINITVSLKKTFPLKSSPEKKPLHNEQSDEDGEVSDIESRPKQPKGVIPKAHEAKKTIPQSKSSVDHLNSKKLDKKGDVSKGGMIRNKDGGVFKGPLAALFLELSSQGEGREDVVLGLLDEGVDLKAKDQNGNTSLYVAAINGRNKCIPLMIDAGADLNTNNSRGDVALHAAVRAPSNELECVQLLIDGGANYSIKNTDKQTPLALAISLNKKHVASFLGSLVGKNALQPLSKAKI